MKIEEFCSKTFNLGENITKISLLKFANEYNLVLIKDYNAEIEFKDVYTGRKVILGYLFVEDLSKINIISYCVK